jgi:hypothetical protein
MLDDRKTVEDISTMKSYWEARNTRFKEWYEFLTLVDMLKTNGMESVVSNEPQTFYNMAHYLLTKGTISHTTPIEAESALELDRRAKINRACEYMWTTIDRERRIQGSQPFIDELSFYLLTLGWYSVVESFDDATGEMDVCIWSPIEVFPKYLGGKFASCTHSYTEDIEAVRNKAEYNGWNFESHVKVGTVTIDDHFVYEDNTLWNKIYIDSKPVTGWIDRPDMRLLVAPVGGFPDKGSLSKSGFTGTDWRRLAGRGIFEVNEPVTKAFNKWKTIMAQILRDTAQPVTQEFSATPQATVEQLRQRGALFHYGQGEGGLKRLEAPVIPIELQAQLAELRREMQKGSFNDAVFGMMDGQGGYALSLIASSSANQILYPYMDAKHFVLGESDKFWLDNLKRIGKTFSIKGKFVEKLEPKDIPDDITMEVESNVATPKDWLERGTISGLLKDHLDEATIITDILGMSDPQSIKRRRSLDRMLEHPMSQNVEMIAGYQVHADYLELNGDFRQANLFRKAAMALESQMGTPPAGSASPVDASRVAQQVEQGTAPTRPPVNSQVMPPEGTGGFTPAQLRKSIGRGTVRKV